jgi:prepilin-type N-terminal cleavage/methylation domain-containing protein
MPFKSHPLPESRPSAFSLVELSIVLVILGLLIGGILSGQSLIRAAELRSVVADYQRYAAAMHTFRDKYFALPGDMTNATAFWNSLGGTGSDATCQALSATGKPTCNGNGDGQILTSTATIYDERFRSWQHMANASLVEGSYTGLNGTADSTFSPVIGTNVPRAKLANGFFDINYTHTGNVNSPTGALGDINRLSLYGNSSSTKSILKPEEAWNIDTKLDDGHPIFGRVYTTKKTATLGTNCATADAAPSAYDLTNSAILCVLHMGI